MRLIDAEPLWKKIRYECGFDCWGRISEADVLTKIDIAPTIDAVPVVRCKDCTWFNHGYCMSFDDDVMPNGFCSRGHTET